jgi:hypothetical protein
MLGLDTLGYAGIGIGICWDKDWDMVGLGYSGIEMGYGWIGIRIC